MLIVDKETVSVLIARISRWYQGRVMPVDPWLGSRVVSGVFDLNDPFGALEAVVRPFGARVRKVTPFLTVISPV
jgi:transmembrane sensor